MNYFFQKFGRILVIWLPLGWLLLFFMLPLVEMINVSFSEARRAVPPYIPAFQIGSGGFSYKSFYPFSFFYYIKIIDKILTKISSYLFAARMLVVLEKK